VLGETAQTSASSQPHLIISSSAPHSHLVLTSSTSSSPHPILILTGLHGGGSTLEGGFGGGSTFFNYIGGRFLNGLTTIGFELETVNKGDGGFACVSPLDPYVWSIPLG